MIVEVFMEYPTGSETEEIELPDDATEIDIEEAAQEAFNNCCNYGFRVKEQLISQIEQGDAQDAPNELEGES